MARITLQSPGWEIRRRSVARGATAAESAALPGLPPDFLTDRSAIEDELILQPRAAVRGIAPATPGPIDLTCELDRGESAILALRRPSHALTFHPPIERVPRTRGGPVVARFVVPAHEAAPPSTTRGVVDTAVKAIIVKVADAAIDKTVSLALPALARAFETTTWKQKGLKEGWLKVTADSLAASKLVAATPTSTDRSLLLIHGTFSNAASAFVSLSRSTFFADVASRYADRIFAFDHFTLSRTPEENARMLLESLPDERFTFDAITHSRGGLVLRNLVERAKVFGPLAKRFRLGRVVLIASPNDGTPLATPRRWEDTIGWVANLLEIFPDNPFTTGAAFVANGLVWLARHASGDLPGLSAMDGNGAMIVALQDPPGPPADRYSALVANYNPSADVLARLLDVGLDQFFGSANDLVVPSEGGWRIDRSSETFIPGSRIGCFGPGGNLPGDTVTHVNIFAQPDAPRFLASALAGEAHAIASIDPAKNLPDRRLLRAGAAGVAAPVLTSTARPAAPVAPAPAARRARKATASAHAAEESAGPASFTITVVNGDLTFERRPLLVGHYRATQLTGTEAVIDRMTARAMSRSLDLGVYPVEPGSHQIFLNTFANTKKGLFTPRPRAVIVVGLGQEGALRPAQLAQSVRQAIIAWAQRVAEAGDTTPLDLASTLMGSGGSGMSAAQAATLIAQGVFDANRLLTRKDWGLPHVTSLRIIELYTDRASEAWRALRMQADATPGRFEVTDPIAIGTGPLLRPIESGYRGADYDYIVATTRHEPRGETAIEYALDTTRARTEVRAQITQVRLVQSLVKKASSTEERDRGIGRALYKLLVPVELEAFLSSARDTQIVLDETTAGIPWELLDDEDRKDEHERPWALRAKLLRKFKTETFRPQVVDATARAPILVIGEPATPAAYPRLPGAYAEAKAVHDCLSSAGPRLAEQVKTVMAETEDGPGPDAHAVVGALLEQDWRIVHIAGHGVAVTPDGAQGGVVLSGEMFLRPQEIAAMRVTPELVFVNCCHQGAIADYDRVRFASSLARTLIDIGVRCVIAAGWAVDDTAARLFAETFYSALLKTARFIDAVALAREAAYRCGGNTWAAYQCYGDPDWTLVGDRELDVATTTPEEEFQEIGTIAGVTLALRTLIAQSTLHGDTHPPARQVPRVRALEQRWRDMKLRTTDGVGELFAEAYAETDAIDDALRWYDVALDGRETDVSVRAFERRSSLRIRQACRAVDIARNGKAKGRSNTTRRRRTKTKTLEVAVVKARHVIDEETARLSALPMLRDTAARETQLGSAMKRLSMIETVAGRGPAARTAAVKAREHYQRALDHHRKAGTSDVFYPALNVIAANLALGAERQALDATLFDLARRGLHEREAEGATFWSMVGEIELRLYKAVADRQLDARQHATRASFEHVAAHVRGRRWESVHDTAMFVLSNYMSGRQSARPKKEIEAGRAIVDYLKTLL